MKIPSEYTIFDWLGDEDYLNPIYKSGEIVLPPKKFLDQKFDLFMERVPAATAQIAKLMPEIVLDHSAESLSAVDAWLVEFLDAYESEYRSEMKSRGIDYLGADKFREPGSVITETTPLLRSVVNDLYIYYNESVASKISGLRWAVCDGSKGYWHKAGFPDLIGDVPGFRTNLAYVQDILITIVGMYRGMDVRMTSFRRAFDRSLWESTGR
jgi:hypothetical protein